MARAQSMDFILRPLVLLISVIGVASANLVYLDYQLIAIKQWAVVENLKARPDLKRYSSFWVDDKIGDFSKTNFSWYEADNQAWYEWSAIFKKAWSKNGMRTMSIRVKSFTKAFVMVLLISIQRVKNVNLLLRTPLHMGKLELSAGIFP